MAFAVKVILYPYSDNKKQIFLFTEVETDDESSADDATKLEDDIEDGDDDEEDSKEADSDDEDDEVSYMQSCMTVITKLEWVHFNLVLYSEIHLRNIPDAFIHPLYNFLQDDSSVDETYPEQVEQDSSMTQPSRDQQEEVESESVSQEPVELDTPTVDSGMRVASPVPNASASPEPVLLHHVDDVHVAHAQHHQISHSQAVSAPFYSIILFSWYCHCAIYMIVNGCEWEQSWQ